jgi:hypothetical protein
MRDHSYEVSLMLQRKREALKIAIRALEEYQKLSSTANDLSGEATQDILRDNPLCVN